MSSEKRFSYEWQKFHQIIPEYEEQFRKWTAPLSSQDYNNKVILDAGCGTGRNSMWPAIYRAKKIIAFDFDEQIVAVARKNLAQFKTVHVKFGNIYDIKYENKFDISHAIGVIQHLDSPNLAIRELVKATKRGGLVLVWVLGREGNGWIVRFITPIRFITSRLPLPLVDRIAFLIGMILTIYVRIVKSKHPYIKQLSKYNFHHIHSIVLDHLLPRIAHYWTRDEAKNLLTEAGLRNVKIYSVNNNSWTVIGTK